MNILFTGSLIFANGQTPSFYFDVEGKLSSLLKLDHTEIEYYFRILGGHIEVRFLGESLNALVSTNVYGSDLTGLIDGVLNQAKDIVEILFLVL